MLDCGLERLRNEGMFPLDFQQLPSPAEICQGKSVKTLRRWVDLLCYIALWGFTERWTWLLLGGGKSTSCGCACVLGLSPLRLLHSSPVWCFLRQSNSACVLIALWSGGVAQSLTICDYPDDNLPWLWSISSDIPPSYSGSQLFMWCRFSWNYFVCPWNPRWQICSISHENF